MGPVRLFPAVFLALAGAAYAERLPIQTFTSSDGLASDRVKCIVRDSRGLLWFCSAGGVDWFDGQRFTGHMLDDRLAFSTNGVFEASDHTYWISTNGRGVVHFDPAAEHVAAWPPREAEGSSALRLRSYQLGDTVASNRVNAVFRDRAGRVWAGTDSGLYSLDESDRFRAEPLPQTGGSRLAVHAFAETADGSLWIATSAGLFRRRPDGATTLTRVPSVAGAVFRLFSADDGTLWIAHSGGLSRGRLTGASPADSLDAVALSIARAAGPPDAMAQAAGGIIWIGYGRGPLIRYDGRESREFTSAQGLVVNGPRAVAVDAEGNVWISDMTTGGAMRILRNGFHTFGRGDGLRSEVFTELLETHGHEVCGLAGFEIEPKLDCFDGRRFQPVHPRLPPAAVGWQARRRLFQARDGSWWFATATGLYRFAPSARIRDLERAPPVAVYTAATGLPVDSLEGVFEDSRGDVWMWFVTRDGCGFSRRMHDSGAVLPVAGIPPSKEPNDIGEDADGNVWVTFRDGGLARWRHGAIRMFGRADGLPDAWTASVYVDHRRRLWISSAAGTALLNVEDQSGDHPRFVWFSPADGLPSPRSAGYFTEDRWGNLYAGTGYGVDRIDADRMHGVRFGAADGMIDVQAWSVLADSSGWLWAATSKGIARFFPEKVEPPRPSVVRIHAFRIAGTRYPLSFVGETNVSDVSIPLGYSPIEFEYATVAGNVQYQYRLDAGSRDWRSVRNASITLASLPAGSYHFAVRAVGRDGVVLGPPATVAFTIVPPFWQRWWFQTLAVAAILAAGLGAYRYRVARLLELERIRTRIATELHDDIGSSLSQIAILSEVASRRVGTTAPDVTPALQSIQRTASEMVDSMSDIVWAINPRQDALADLAGRMRRFGSDLLGGRDITFEFDTSNLDAGIHVSPELRREVFLTFKEGLRNIVRHSRCTRVAATLRAGGGSLELTLVDNGIGFDPDSPATGLGLANLRSRAAALGGVLDIRSAAGHGTSIHLRLPLRRSTGPFPYWRRP